MDQKDFEVASPVAAPRTRSKLPSVGRLALSALSLIMAFEYGRRAYGYVPNQFDKFVFRDVGLIWAACLVIYMAVAMWQDTGSPPKPGEVPLMMRRYAAVVYLFLMVQTLIAVIFHRAGTRLEAEGILALVAILLVLVRYLLIRRGSR